MNKNISIYEQFMIYQEREWLDAISDLLFRLVEAHPEKVGGDSDRKQGEEKYRLHNHDKGVLIQVSRWEKQPDHQSDRYHISIQGRVPYTVLTASSYETFMTYLKKYFG